MLDEQPPLPTLAPLIRREYSSSSRRRRRAQRKAPSRCGRAKPRRRSWRSSSGDGVPAEAWPLQDVNGQSIFFIGSGSSVGNVQVPAQLGLRLDGRSSRQPLGYRRLLAAERIRRPLRCCGDEGHELLRVLPVEAPSHVGLRGSSRRHVRSRHVPMIAAGFRTANWTCDRSRMLEFA